VLNSITIPELLAEEDLLALSIDLGIEGQNAFLIPAHDRLWSIQRRHVNLAVEQSDILFGVGQLQALFKVQRVSHGEDFVLNRGED